LGFAFEFARPHQGVAASRIQVRVALEPVVEREHLVQLIAYALKSAGCQHTLLADSCIRSLGCQQTTPNTNSAAHSRRRMS
jgi:hypothetical protein